MLPAHRNFIRKILIAFSYLPDKAQTRRYCIQKMSSHDEWKNEKSRMLSLPLEARRKNYKDYIMLDKVDPWCQYVVKHKHLKDKKHTLEDLKEFRKITLDPEKNKSLSEKVSIFQGDITKLEVDAIVNAANSRLLAGGGVDGAIHRAAGPLLQQECCTLGGCPTGEARITGGYCLPAKFVVHTVGPQDGCAPMLEVCYRKCLAFHKMYRITTMAFPCISTGIYGFPNRLAAHVALRTVRKYLESNNEMERVIFCTFLPLDVDIYETLMQMYFPVQGWNYNDGASVSE